ncbi:hypothetical protein IWX50DRAFT_488185 [Phyllosticta citricarpa]
MGNPNMDWPPGRKMGNLRPRESPSYSAYRADDQRAFDLDSHTPGRPGPYSTLNKIPFGKLRSRPSLDSNDRNQNDDFHQPLIPRLPPRPMEDGHQMRSPRPLHPFQDANRPDSPPGPFQDPRRLSSTPVPHPSGLTKKNHLDFKSSLTWENPKIRGSPRSEASRQTSSSSVSERPRASGPGSGLASEPVGLVNDPPAVAEKEFQRQLSRARHWVATEDEVYKLKRFPHIFISAKYVPYRSLIAPEIARILRISFSGVKVKGSVNGYYVTFPSTPEGRAGLQRCIQNHDGTFIHKQEFQMVMEPHPFGSGPLARNLPPSPPPQQNAETPPQDMHNRPPPNATSQQDVRPSFQHSIRPEPPPQQTPRQHMEAEDIAIHGAASHEAPSERVSNFNNRCLESKLKPTFDHEPAWGLPKGRPGWSVTLKLDNLKITDPGPYPRKMDASAAIVTRGYSLLEQVLQTRDRKLTIRSDSLEVPDNPPSVTTGSAPDMNTPVVTTGSTPDDNEIRRLQHAMNSRLSRAKEMEVWLANNTTTSDEAMIKKTRDYINDLMKMAEGYRQELVQIGGLPATTIAEQRHVDRLSPPLIREAPSHASADKEPTVSAPDLGQVCPADQPTTRRRTPTPSVASEASSKSRVARCASCKTKHFPSYNQKKICSGCRRAYCNSCWKTESAPTTERYDVPPMRYCVELKL